MPGDTLVITQSGDSLPLSDSALQQASQSALHVIHHDDSMSTPLVIGLIVAGFFLLNWLEKKHKQSALRKAALAASATNFAQYDELLAGFNGYYKSLPETLRHRFVERVAWFMETKNFHYVDLEPDRKIPLLISAASIQISFGLDKFLLDFFDTIYIMKQDYNYGLYGASFEGHVNGEGIYLSWNNFTRGYEDYTDGDNVGIHEMAHALAYVNFMAGANDGKDDVFTQKFYDFSAVARPIFNDMQHNCKNCMDTYGATNYNEFWAVAIETFFEKSLIMKMEMPALYDALCNLLNQDPLLPEKLLTIPDVMI